MTTFAVNVRTDGDYDIDFAVIEITPTAATSDLNYKAVLDRLLAGNPHLVALTMIDHTPLWVRYQEHLNDEALYRVLGYDEAEVTAMASEVGEDA